MHIVQKTHASLTECLIAIRVDGAGSVFDPFPGAHHLLEHLVAKEMDEQIVKLGGRFEAHTYLEYQTFITAIPNEGAKEAMKIIASELRHAQNAHWDRSRIDRARRIIEQERLTHLRNPHEQISEALDQAILSGGYEHPSSVHEQKGHVTRKQLCDIATTAYRPDRMVLICIEPTSDASGRLGNPFNFSTTRPSEPIVFPNCKRSPTRISLASPSKMEAYIRLDFPGIGLPYSEHFMNNVVAEVLVGPFGILEKPLGESGLGLCYDLFSTTSIFHSFAQINFGAACSQKDIVKIERIIKKSISTLSDSTLSHALKQARQSFEQERDRLMLNPYAFFDFLVLESFTGMKKDPNPIDLLSFWKHKKRSTELLYKILNPATMAVAITKKA